MALPFMGVNSMLGDSGKNDSVGFRIGTLVGARLSEHFSLNFQVTLDVLNPQDQRGIDQTLHASERLVDAAVAPLVHVPIARYPLEFVVGPSLGSFYEWGSTSTTGFAPFTNDNWAWGWSVGGNAGVLYRVSHNVRVGALLAFTSRILERSCVSSPGSASMCVTSNLPSAKVLGVGVAALF